MAQLTQQAQALAYAALVANYMGQLRTLQNEVAALLATAIDQNYDGILQALPTFSFTAQGAQGLVDQTAGTGTVDVTNGSEAISFSTAQSGLSGTYIVVTGDTANGIYLIGSGAGTSWTLTSPYGGLSNPTAAWGTSNPTSSHPIALPVGGPLQMARGNVLTANGCLTNFGSFMTGAAVGVQVNTPQKFADILNS